MNDVAAARRETIRYHEALYARPRPAPGRQSGTAPGAVPGTGTGTDWWARPHPLVVEALASVPGPVHAYDLGAGTGRHTLLLADRLPAGSRVTAVDLLPSALDRLTEDAVAAGLDDRIEVVVADLEAYRFAARDAGLVVAVSALEHVTSRAALGRLLARCRDATPPGGVHVLGVFADRREVTARGTRPALIECPLTSGEARETLLRAYRGWEVLVDRCSPTGVAETRDDEAYELRSTLVQFVARAPSPADRPPPAGAS